MSDRPSPPAEIRWLVQLVGEAATVQIIAAYGGTRLPLLKAIDAGSKLAQEIGLEPARRLVDHLGGTRNWKPPACKRWRVQLLRAEGKSYAEIARVLGLNESTVARYIAHPVQAKPL